MNQESTFYDLSALVFLRLSALDSIIAVIEESRVETSF